MGIQASTAFPEDQRVSVAGRTHSFLNGPGGTGGGRHIMMYPINNFKQLLKKIFFVFKHSFFTFMYSMHESKWKPHYQNLVNKSFIYVNFAFRCM